VLTIDSVRKRSTAVHSHTLCAAVLSRIDVRQDEDLGAPWRHQVTTIVVGILRVCTRFRSSDIDGFRAAMWVTFFASVAMGSRVETIGTKASREK
jgi:hypothetical protein